MKNKILISGLTALIILLTTSFTFANKTSVTIDAPASAKIGDEITITLHVTHSGNTSFHFTDWGYLKVNGVEMKRWDFTKSSLPPAATFTLTFKIKVTENMKIEAEGHCNLHGSAGIATAAIKAVE